MNTDLFLACLLGASIALLVMVLLEFADRRSAPPFRGRARRGR